MKRVALTNSRLFAVVDDRDFDLVSQFNWYANKQPHTTYAMASFRNEKIKMHSVLIPSAKMIDHRDGDGLNNTRRNLRPCNQTQNNANGRKRLGTSSKFKGVSWHKPSHKWSASIKHHNKQYYLGTFESERSAALAYNLMSLKLNGDFARLNPV